jgi:hypothetical protein
MSEPIPMMGLLMLLENQKPESRNQNASRRAREMFWFLPSGFWFSSYHDKRNYDRAPGV